MESPFFESKYSPPPIESTDDETIAGIFSRSYSPAGGPHNRRDPIYLEALGLADGDQEKGLKIYQELRRTIDALHVIDWRNPDIDHASQVMDSVVEMARERLNLLTTPNHSNHNEE